MGSTYNDGRPSGRAVPVQVQENGGENRFRQTPIPGKRIGTAPSPRPRPFRSAAPADCAEIYCILKIRTYNQK